MTLAGLRPGEKLYEEKLMAEEGLKKTKNDLIHIGCPIPFDIEEFLDQLEELMEAAYRTIQDWEHGKREMPNYVLRLMQYKMKMEELLKMGGNDDRK